LWSIRVIISLIKIKKYLCPIWCFASVITALVVPHRVPQFNNWYFPSGLRVGLGIRIPLTMLASDGDDAKQDPPSMKKRGFCKYLKSCKARTIELTYAVLVAVA
jgi:hypothetical protein